MSAFLSHGFDEVVGSVECELLAFGEVRDRHSEVAIGPPVPRDSREPDGDVVTGRDAHRFRGVAPVLGALVERHLPLFPLPFGAERPGRHDAIERRERGREERRPLPLWHAADVVRRGEREAVALPQRHRDEPREGAIRGGALGQSLRCVRVQRAGHLERRERADVERCRGGGVDDGGPRPRTLQEAAKEPLRRDARGGLPGRAIGGQYSSAARTRDSTPLPPLFTRAATALITRAARCLSAFFGFDTLEKHGLHLKDLETAVATRNHLLSMFEQASHEADAEKRKAMLTFIIVGGGPTGVETAGALAELITHVMRKDFPRLNLKEAQVILLEAGASLIASYPDELRQATLRLLKNKNVDVRLNTKMLDFNGQRVTLGDGLVIETQTLIWTAGAKAAEIIDTLPAEKASMGRVRINPTLNLPQFPEAFVIGDAAFLANGNGQPLPMLSTVAIQQGQTAAKNIKLMLEGKEPLAFHYKDPGLLATVGRNAAVARIFGISFSGFIAWMIWVFLHIYRIIGFRNRIIVMFNWAWDYFFYDNQVRLITRE